MAEHAGYASKHDGFCLICDADEREFMAWPYRVHVKRLTLDFGLLRHHLELKAASLL